MSSSSLNTVSFEVLESVKFDLNDKYKATCKLFILSKLYTFSYQFTIVKYKTVLESLRLCSQHITSPECLRFLGKHIKHFLH